MMQRYLVLAILLLLVILVVSRVLFLKSKGIKAMRFGEMDRTDYLLPPFFLFYVYVLVSSVTELPQVGSEIFTHGGVAWTGTSIAFLGLILFLASMVSFGKSFRVGIDEEAPGHLVTSGIFAYTRNPVYIAFGLVSLGIFLAIPNWILLLYIAAGSPVVHRQVLREEESLEKTYGESYLQYRRKVPRYF